MKKILEEAIAQKLAVWRVSNDQMARDVAAGILSVQTQECMHIAHESLEAAKMKLSQDKLADAVYFFSRGCWKMGEMMGRSTYEKKTEAKNVGTDRKSIRLVTEGKEAD